MGRNACAAWGSLDGDTSLLGEAGREGGRGKSGVFIAALCGLGDIMPVDGMRCIVRICRDPSHEERIEEGRPPYLPCQVS